jgi:hypothetical protein
MRFWIAGWAGACVALGICALALAYQSAATGPRLAGVQVGMTARAIDGVAGAQVDKVSPSEWYIRNLSYRGRPVDLWLYRDAGADRVQSMRWRQDLRFAPAQPIAPQLPPLTMNKAPSDEGCTAALMQVRGVVRPFTYASRDGAFAARFADQLNAAGFSPAAQADLLRGGQAFAEGFEAVDPSTFGCNFVFQSERRILGQGFVVEAFAEVRMDWSHLHQRYRLYRMTLQLDVRLGGVEADTAT